MKILFTLLALALLCSSPSILAAKIATDAEAQSCIDEGHRPGTQGFYDCLERKVMQRKSQEARRSNSEVS